jgi:hypothetical protein
MDSESSCTYKDYVTAYCSTRDSELWNTIHVVGTEINYNLDIDRVPIMLSDETSPEDIHEVPLIGPQQMEEMMIEPLFSVPLAHKSIVESLIPYKNGSLLVSISTYGLKYLMFSLYGCIMCTNTTDSTLGAGIYIPRRFLDKVTTDCADHGVSCEPYNSGLYHSIDLGDLPEVAKAPFENSQERIISNTNARKVTTSLTPVFGDGFKFYYPVDLTIFIVLDPRRSRVRTYDEAGNLIVRRTKRHIKIVPLCIRQPIKHGNDVAFRTSPA